MYEGNEDVTEYGNWKDTGCDLYPACLECPLPRCIEEEPRGRQRIRMDARTADMLEMRRRGGSVHEIAACYSVSVRTVQRALSADSGGGHCGCAPSDNGGLPLHI